VTVALAVPEQERLRELEAVVDRGVRTFVEVGLALGEIRDRRLYRETHATFEDYLRERWRMSRPRAYELMRGAQAVEVVSAMADIEPPPNARVARELAPLLDEPEVLREAWAELRDEYGDRITAADVRQLVKGTLRNRQITGHMHLSETFEWYTPRLYVEAVREVLGAIDLDPASCEQANATVGAATFYTQDDDGLAQPWFGRLFCNPPYKDLAPLFADKLAAEYDAGNVTEAILLVNSYSTERGWYQRLLAARPVCFVAGRVRFVSPIERGGSPSHGTAFVYFGASPARFVEVFGRFGVVVGWGCTACREAA
jgi:hypothetical protein